MSVKGKLPSCIIRGFKMKSYSVLIGKMRDKWLVLHCFLSTLARCEILRYPQICWGHHCV